MLDHVGATVSDLARSRAFYDAALAPLGIAVIIGAVGFALWYAEQRPSSSPAMNQAIEEVKQKSSNRAPSSGDGGWGIVHDSPLRRR